MSSEGKKKRFYGKERQKKAVQEVVCNREFDSIDGTPCFILLQDW